ncbi:MAG: hypothetical protein FD181_3861 [Prolixibacteraceae bacterium]|nr:MAG: hypothetical protein FD181_3861 [Prolixibacteraceae bacterium]
MAGFTTQLLEGFYLPSYALNNPLKYIDPSGESWKSFWNKIGNWLTRNNIQFQVGVNISGNGTVPFAKGVGLNFNIDTRNFAHVPTASYQKINQQLAGFSGWNNNSSPRFGNGDVINQQFVGESPMAGGVAQNSWDFQSSIYASSVVLNLLVSTEEINTGLNLTSTLEKANAYKSITNTIPKSLRLELDYARMTNTLLKSVSTKLFFAGALYTGYEVQKNPTLDNAAWGILDTSIGGLALVSGYATIPAIFYYVGRIGNDIYQSSRPQEPLIFQSSGWKELKKNGY